MHPVGKLLGQSRKVSPDLGDLGCLAGIIIPAVEKEGDASLKIDDLLASAADVFEQLQHVARITFHDGLVHDLDDDELLLDRGGARQGVSSRN